MRLLPHFHRDPDWQEDGIYRLHACPCGAKRIRWVNRKLYGAIPDGYPSLTDRHGRQLADSGWVKS